MPTRKEFEAMPDLRAELPPGVILNLDQHDKVILIEDHIADIAPPDRHYTAEQMICRLGGVRGPKALGRKFIVASGKFPGHKTGKTQGKFVVPFPRDFAYMMLALKLRYPHVVARGILQINQYLALGYNRYRAAERGRDAHEVRDMKKDKKAQELHEKQHWLFPYHGQVDVGPLVIRLIHWVCFEGPEGIDFLWQPYVGEDGNVYNVLDSLELRERWLLRRLRQGDGLLEFRAEFEGSHVVQTMEDSKPSHLRKDGTQADFSLGVSSTEVLGDTWEALICLAEIYEYLEQHHGRGDLGTRARKLRRAAMSLKQLIMGLWIPRENYFAMGYDHGPGGKLRRLDALKAIPAFILDTRLFTEEKRDREIVERYVSRLLEPDMFCQAGFRTLSAKHPWFNPGRYHLGAIWPFMNFRIAEGLRRQGFHRLAHLVYENTHDGFRRLQCWPELIRGNLDGSYEMSRHRIRVYNSRLGFDDTINNVPQILQGWSLSAEIGSAVRLREALPPATPFERKLMG